MFSAALALFQSYGNTSHNHGYPGYWAKTLMCCARTPPLKSQWIQWGLNPGLQVWKSLNFVVWERVKVFQG